MNLPEVFNILVITLSDRAYRGEYEDLSGPAAVERLSGFFRSSGFKFTTSHSILPDDRDQLSELLRTASEMNHLIVTTGGTGIGPRDITVETVKPLLSKEIPGIMEFIRVKYGAAKPNALLSRGVAGIIGKSLIYTLPGSPRAVEEYLGVILETLRHTINMQYGIDAHS